MARRFSQRLGLGSALGLAMALLAGSAHAASSDESAPYRMVRTLQSIQDAVIAGDLAAVDMQRFLLGEIDRRLRSASPDVFDDPRNVDATLIYAMSGGNPETLDFIAGRDVAGNFDNRVTAILRRYLSGKGATVVKQLKEVVPEYRNTRIGPYLELIGANALMEKETDIALKYFDWARLEAPGSIVEEAALRRGLSITARKGDLKKALPYARRYARRFMTSPYASQFADIFVGLAVDHESKLSEAEIKAILSLIERKRQREIYLRLARRAAINGDKVLAEFAAEEARGLSLPEDKSQLALAELYSGLVKIPSSGVDEVLERLAAIPDEELPVKDRFLRDAARIVAEEVLQPPGDDSLTQVRRSMIDKEYRDMMAQKTLDAGETGSIAGARPDPKTTEEKKPEQAEVANKQALDAKLDSVENFVSSGRSRLNKIDALLSGESD